MNPTNRRRAAITAALAAFGLGSFVSTQDADAQRRPDRDFDNDGINNRADRDDDNDGIPDRRDRDDDNDGRPDVRDRDDDNNGIRDRNDTDSRRDRTGRPVVRGQWRFNYRPLRYDDRHYDDLDMYDLGYGFDRDEFIVPFERDYRRFDRNRDGRLTLRERRAFWIHMARMGMFGPIPRHQELEMAFLASVLDVNGNGRLTPFEVRRLTRYIKGRQLFRVLDRDHDGRLFRREARGWFIREFRELDLNRDRSVTPFEMRRALLNQPRRGYWAR